MNDDSVQVQRLCEFFRARLNDASQPMRPSGENDSRFRSLTGGLHDAAALIGLSSLARRSRNVLAGHTQDVRTLHESLPTPEVLERALAAFVSAQGHAAAVDESSGEPAVVVLSEASTLSTGLRTLPDGRGNATGIFDTRDAAVAAIQARPGAVTVLVVDEATLSEDVVPELTEQLQSELQSGRLGMVLLVESMDIESLRRAWRAGFTAVEPRGQSASALDRCIQLVAARCRTAAGLRVLLVDDDELTRATSSALLTAAGMAVDTLECLADLPEILAGQRPDLVLVAGDTDEVSAREIVGLLELCAFDAEPGIVFLARAADSSPKREQLHAAGFEVLYPEHGAGRFIARVRGRAARNRAHASERNRLLQRDEERDQVARALNQHALVSVTDRKGTIVHANNRFCRVSGYAREELVGQNHRMINSGTHPPGFFREMWQKISRGRIWQGTICNRARDGSLYWVKSTIVPFMNGSGRPYRYISIRTDVTRFKNAKESAALRNKAIDASSNGIVLADMRRPDQPIIEVNPAFESMTGYSRHEATGRNCRFLQGPDTEPEVMAEIRAALAEKRVANVTLRNYRKDGSLFWNQLSLSPIFSDEGELTHYVGIQNDITDRVEAEHAVARTKRRLHLGQEYANIGTWEWDIKTGELFWTETIPPLFGYARGALETSFDNFLAALHPDDHQSVLDAIDACIEHEQPYAIEHRVVWPDGSVRWLSEHGAVERSETGEPLRMIGVVQDIDERKRAVMQLMAAREEADRANQAKSEFLSRMSHELRTPMNAVLGFSQLMQADPGLSEEHADNAEEIIKAGGHLLELINDVLDLSRIESGRIQVSIEPVSVAPLVDECMSLVEDMARRHSVSLHPDVSNGLVLLADRTRLKQVILNLLSNAIKYNHPDGRVWLRTELRQSDNKVVISVSDTGHGIAAEKIARLWEPFERIDAETCDVEGTGIGLTITRRLVELMGGAIRVESELGQGSNFMIDLPLADDVTDNELEELAKDGGASSGVSGSATVLYVEDNPSNIRLMARALGRQRHINLLTAHNAELGIELAISRRPDLILLDINLPGMDGYEVLGVIRAEASLREVPVLAVSANALPREYDRAREAGFSEYLTKPLDLEKLLQAIARFMVVDEAPADE